ncbi:hypothetical protein WJX73_001491 [Symbiochloris irregularis]|uniref:IPT/TIG domain-containing protein n=1 Tax=Symbiochloris irregularis TaxID=706552 RepID=A0AAW1PUL5_9CHLO
MLSSSWPFGSSWLVACLLSTLSFAQAQAPQGLDASTYNVSAVLIGQLHPLSTSCLSDGSLQVELNLQLPRSNPTLGNWQCIASSWDAVQGVHTGSQNGSIASPEAAFELSELLAAPSSSAGFHPQVQLGPISQRIVTCKLSSYTEQTAIVLVAKPDGQFGAAYIALPTGPVQAPFVKSISPTLGPADGGTDILLLGNNLRPPLQCLFSNSTTQISVPATVFNSSAALCTSPNWTVVADSIKVQLTVTGSQCQTKTKFSYYSTFSVRSVQPLLAPRYGSFMMTVYVDEYLHTIAGGQNALRPLIRLKGGEGNGTDLVLPANFTADKRALLAVTPAEKSPYAAGSHPIHISLNGQQFAPVNSTVVLPGNNLHNRDVLQLIQGSDTTSQTLDFRISSAPLYWSRDEGLPSEKLVSTFTLQPNQVAYPGDNVSIPLAMTNPALPVPSFMAFSFTALEGDLSFLPRGADKGILEWAGGSQESTAHIHLPIEWDDVPLWAEYRLAVTLTPLWLATVSQVANQTALHLFGVADGQCPPGTIRLHTADAPAPAPEAPAPPPAADARMRSLVVQDSSSGNDYDLSTPFSPGVLQYAAMVPANLSTVTLCVQPWQSEAVVEIVQTDLNASISSNSSSFQPVQGNDANSTADSSSTYTLSLVRLSPPDHSFIAELNASVKGSTFSLCSDAPSAEGWPELDDAGSLAESPGPPGPCVAGTTMAMNVTYDTETVFLQPRLLFPDIQGLRVEVNGQVLSKGGDVGADQVMDTTAESVDRDNNDFLPLAVILGLSPGEPLVVPIVVLAEDGVTSSVYHVSVLRAVPPEGTVSAQSLDSIGNDSSLALGPSLINVSVSSASGGAGLYKKAEAPPPPIGPLSTLPAGWPLPPSRTFSAAQGSRLCTMCPSNMTNLQDGSDDCTVPIIPGTNLKMRYAVIVSFGIFLNGTDLDEVASKVGVNASAQDVLGHLIRQDTALAFNISEEDVTVTGISQVARRVLQVNISATLPLDLPEGASQDDIDDALEVTNLSADDPIAMLSSNPDKFFGRTTKALDVTAEPVEDPTRTESNPFDHGALSAGQIWPIAVGVTVAVVVLIGLALQFLRRKNTRVFSLLAGRCGRCLPERSKPPWQRQVNDKSPEESAAKGISERGLMSRPSVRPLMGKSSDFTEAPDVVMLRGGGELASNHMTTRSALASDCRKPAICSRSSSSIARVTHCSTEQHTPAQSPFKSRCSQLLKCRRVIYISLGWLLPQVHNCRRLVIAGSMLDKLNLDSPVWIIAKLKRWRAQLQSVFMKDPLKVHSTPRDNVQLAESQRPGTRNIPLHYIKLYALKHSPTQVVAEQKANSILKIRNLTRCRLSTGSRKQLLSSPKNKQHDWQGRQATARELQASKLHEITASSYCQQACSGGLTAYLQCL